MEMENKDILKSHSGVYLIQKSFFILEVKLVVILLVIQIISDIVTLAVDNIPTINIPTNLVPFLIYDFVRFAIKVSLVSRVIICWVFDRYIIDAENKRLYLESGFFQAHERMFDLSLIRSIHVKQSFLGRIFGYGSIVITTTASGGYQELSTIKNIKNPWKINKLLEGIILAEKVTV